MSKHRAKSITAGYRFQQQHSSPVSCTVIAFSILCFFSEISNPVPSLEGKFFGVPLSNTLQYHIFMKEIFYSKQKISNRQKKLPNSGNHECWLVIRLTATSKKVPSRGFVAIVSIFSKLDLCCFGKHTRFKVIMIQRISFLLWQRRSLVSEIHMSQFFRPKITNLGVFVR